ncbi:MAG: DUF861 domain-containing protein [Rhodospirillaceae bacterium]|nr:DUF861 domain-containing protein [Rhodospirillaceae bacterium]
MSTPSVIKYSRHDGTADRLQRWPDIPASELESGSPVQRGLEYFGDQKLGLTSGIWDCTPMVTHMGPYPVHEFMIVLEGSVTIRDAGGRDTTISAGESFILPKGFVCQWRQSEYMKKFYVIFDDPSGTAAADPGALRILKLDADHDLRPSPPPAADLLIGPAPEQYGHEWYEDPTGQWTVGVWGSSPYRRKAMPFPRHELMHLLSGSVTLTDPALGAQRFAAGDTFFVPMGANVEWHSTEPVRKLYSIFIPKT